MKKSDHNSHHHFALNISMGKILLLFCLFLPAAAFARTVELDHIIVVVNNDVITEKMLDNRVHDFQQQLKLGGLSDTDLAALRKQVLARMIRDQIQLQKAKQLGIQVDDLLLNRMLKRLADSNKMTLEQFRDTINRNGMSYSRFRKQTRDELIIKRLQQRMVVSKIDVSNQEIEQYIKQNQSKNASNAIYHLRHILISIPEEASPEAIQHAKKKSDAIYKKILAGSKFQDMAIKYSNGRNALKDGDLGERKVSELPELFIHAVKNLKPGETAKPVRSASGFHILQLVSRSNGPVMVKQTHARHILIRTSSQITDAEARKTLLDIRKKIEHGKSFAQLARQYSDDPGSKAAGGDLGWAKPGNFVPAFETVMNSLKKGQISQPFKSQFGWHLLQVLGRRNHDQSKANKINAARTDIQKRKVGEELRLWLRRIHDEAYIKYVDKTYNPNKNS